MRKGKMLKNLCNFLLISIILLAAYGTSSIEAAEIYPNKPITLWVPFAAGGSVDASSRLIAVYAAKYLNTSIAVENMEGADGVICYNKAFAANPDGYTLFSGNVLSLIVREFSRENIQYKARDFKPIFLFTKETSVLVAHPGVCKTIQEFLKLARSQTMKVGTTSKYGTSGTNGILFEDRTKLKFNWIPYDSGRESLTALAGKHIDAVITTIASSLGLVKGGKIVPILTFADVRNPAYPNVPVPSEVGLDIPPLNNQVGIMGPPGLPGNKIRVLEEAFVKVGKDPEFNKMIEARGGATELNLLPSEDFKKEFDRVYAVLDKYRKFF